MLLAFAVVLRLALLVLAAVASAVAAARLTIVRNAMKDWLEGLFESRRHSLWLSRIPQGMRFGAFLRKEMLEEPGYVYLGTDRGKWIVADPEHAVLVLGPPRQGKTSAVVIPTILAASGPVVSTSTKPDVLQQTGPTRSQIGICWLFDPSGLLPAPQGVKLLRWSPIAACATWNLAWKLSQDIVAISQPAEGMRDAGHWGERAASLLAAFMHAAALDGKGMREVLAWTSRQDYREPESILERCDAARAIDTLISIERTGPNERSGIYSTASSALDVYQSDAALALTDHPNFDPKAFVTSRDTVYITASSQYQKVTAPLVVALLAEIQDATFAAAAQQDWGRPRLTPPMLWMLDEVANIAPIPELPAIVSEAGGQGLVVVTCLQDLSQARKRWGNEADGFLSLFGTKLIFPGLWDPQTLRSISEVVGDHDVPVVTETQIKNKPIAAKDRRAGKLQIVRSLSSSEQHTYATQMRREPQLPPSAIAQGRDGMALLLRTGQSPLWTFIRYTKWFECSPWRQVVEADRRLTAEDPQPGQEET
jgi:type IV secretory pathway TraG/TraD family ATPase VirD4